MAARKDLTSGRARRAIKIGGLASQVGSSYLWTSLRRPFLSAGRYEQELLDTHLKNARRIVEGSQQLRGAFMKLIQMLSTRADMLPGEALDILKATQSSVPPMDYPLIAKQIRREFSKSPEQLFASFEREAFAAASLGQVHRARLKSGEEVAVKIQYPGVDATVEQDLGNLKLLLRTLQAIARRHHAPENRHQNDFYRTRRASARRTRLRHRSAQHHRVQSPARRRRRHRAPARD